MDVFPDAHRQRGGMVMKRNIKNVLLAGCFLAIVIVHFPDFAVASSRLRVNCDVEGAEVFLDEKFKGECPVEFEVSAGKHKVALRKDLDDGSYYYYERETRVGEDVIQEINAQLQRIYTEQYYWNRAEKSGKIEYYREYLMRYPEGKFANEAKVKIKKQIEEQRKKLMPLRSESLTVSEGDAHKIFGLDESWRPLTYIENDFEDRGEVVVDRKTGLMWQKSGSDKGLSYEEVQAYVQHLKDERFAGYSDWRLPTVPELLTLVEPEQQSNGLYINPIFDEKQSWCWSADLVRGSRESAWSVHFPSGYVYWNYLDYGSYVRAVRSRQ